MDDKLVRDLVLSSTNTTFSDAVPLGGNNSAMSVAWLKAKNGSGTISVSMEGSNDRVNWRPIGTSTISLSTVPAYDEFTGAPVIPYAYVRLKFASTATTALVDASVRTFMTT